MRVITTAQLRKSLSAVLDSPDADRAPVLVTRPGTKPAAVLMSLEEYSAHTETQHLLRIPANARRLQASIAEFGEGKGDAP